MVMSSENFSATQSRRNLSREQFDPGSSRGDSSPVGWSLDPWLNIHGWTVALASSSFSAAGIQPVLDDLAGLLVDDRHLRHHVTLAVGPKLPEDDQARLVDPAVALMVDGFLVGDLGCGGPSLPESTRAAWSRRAGWRSPYRADRTSVGMCSFFLLSLTQNQNSFSFEPISATSCRGRLDLELEVLGPLHRHLAVDLPPWRPVFSVTSIEGKARIDRIAAAFLLMLVTMIRVFGP